MPAVVALQARRAEMRPTRSPEHRHGPESDSYRPYERPASSPRERLDDRMNSRKRPITSGHSPPESKRSRSLALDHVDNQYAVSSDGQRGSVPPTFEATRRIESTSGRADRYDGYRSSENTRLGPPAHRMSTDATTMLRTQRVGSPQQHYVASPASIHGESAHNRSGNSTPQSTMAPPRSTTLATQAKQTAPSSKASADFAKLSTYNQVYSYLKTERNKAKLKQEYGQIPYPPNVSSLRRLRDQKLQLAQNEYNGAKKKFPAELTVSRGGMDHASNVPSSTDEQEMFYKTQYDKLQSQHQEMLEKLNKFQDDQRREMREQREVFQNQMETAHDTSSRRIDLSIQNFQKLQERVQALELPDHNLVSLNKKHEALRRECDLLKDQVKMPQASDIDAQMTSAATSLQKVDGRVKALETRTSSLADQLETTSKNEEETFAKTQKIDEYLDKVETWLKGDDKGVGFFDRVCNLEEDMDQTLPKLRTALNLLDTKFQALGSSTSVIDTKPSTGDIDITTLRAEIARSLGPVEEKQTKLESTIARQEDALQKVLDNSEGLQSNQVSPRKLTDSFGGTQTSSPTEESSRKLKGFDRNREHVQQNPHTPQSHDILHMGTRFEVMEHSQQLKSLQSQQEQSATSIAAQQVLIETVQRTLSELNADVKKRAVNPDADDENSVAGVLKRPNALAEFQKNAEEAVEVHNEAVARVDQEAKTAKSLVEKNRDDVASIDQKIKELPVNLASRFETMHAAFTSDAVFKKTKKEIESELTLQFANFTTIIDSKLNSTIARNDEIDKRVSDLEQSRTQTATELEDLSDIVPKVETLEKTVFHLEESFTTAASNEDVLGLKAQVNELLADISSTSSLAGTVQGLETKVVGFEESLTTTASADQVLRLQEEVNRISDDVDSTSSLAGRVPGLEAKLVGFENKLATAASAEQVLGLEGQVNHASHQVSSIPSLAERIRNLERKVTKAEDSLSAKFTTRDQALRKIIKGHVSQCADAITAAQRDLSAKIDDTEQALRDHIEELVPTAETSVAAWDARIRELTSLVEDTKTEFKSDVAETNSKVNSIDRDVSNLYVHAGNILPATEKAVNTILEQKVEAAEVKFKELLSSLEKRQSEQAEDIVRLNGSRTISQQSKSVNGVVDLQNSLEDLRKNMVHATKYNDLQERVKAWNETRVQEINAIRTNHTQLDQRVNHAVRLATSGSAGQVNVLSNGFQLLTGRFEGLNDIINNTRHIIWNLQSQFNNINTEDLYHRIWRVVANDLPNAPVVISQLQGGLSEVRLQTEKLQKDIRGLENTAASSDHLRQLLERVTNVETTLANWRADISSISDLRTENIEVSDRARSGLDLAQGLETRVNDLSSQCAELTKPGGKSAQNALKSMDTTIDQLRTELEDRVKLIETKIAAVERNANQIPVLELKVGELKADTEESFRELGQCVTGFRYPLGESHFGPQGEPTPPKSTSTGPRRGRRPGQACSDNS